MTTRKSNRKSKKSKKIFRKTRSKKGGVETRSGKNTGKAFKVSKTIKQTKPKTPTPSPKKEPVDNCPICQESMDNVDELVTTKPCKHTFHQDCLRRWCNEKHTCPVCREQIPETCASLMPPPPPGIFTPEDRDELRDAVERYIDGDYSDGNIADWDTSNVTDMSKLFVIGYRGTDISNIDISRWNTSRVTDMSEMFRSCKFNGDISNWDTSSVTTMEEMFRGVKDFNGDISRWNTSNVTNMEGNVS